MVEFAIRDTGIGIEAGFMAQVFDNFSQKNPSITRQFGGLGMGISKKPVELMGGEREKCLAAGMNDYLTNPFQEASMIKMVYNWITVDQVAE